MVLAIQDVQSLAQPPFGMTVGKPRAGFFVPVIVMKHLKALHPSPPSQQLTKVADAMRWIGNNLGYAAAQYNPSFGS